MAVIAATSETEKTGWEGPAGIGLACVGLAVGALVAAVSLAAEPHMPTDAVVLHALGTAIPIAVGSYFVAARKNARLGFTMVGAGLLGFVITLAESSDSTTYSIGRLAAWLVEALLVYLILAFPFGRLVGSVERRLFSASVLIVALLYVPTVLVAQYPTPSPWAACGTHCPPNAFAIGGVHTAFVNDFIRPLREILSALIFAGVAGVVIRRARQSGTLVRRMIVPVAVVAVLRAAAMVVYFPARGLGSTSGTAEVLGWMYGFSPAAIALACGLGLIAQRLFAARALQRLATGLNRHAHATELREALSEALEDPPLRVVFRLRNDAHRWVDENGWPVMPPEPGEGQAVTEVRSDGHLRAAIIHDAALSMDPELVDAAASYALTAVENGRLVDQLQSSLRELSESRARIISVADQERRKIERDLHDGAQQRLVALRVKLELIAEKLDEESPEGAAAIRRFEDDVEATIDEVRSFARGVYPSLLAERGLGEALRAAGRSASVPTMVDAAGLGRYPPEIESTVYFACTEALQNVSKHALGASAAIIRVRENGRLVFEVRDDGEGFDISDRAHGTALASLSDRIAAVGGELVVESAPGAGTTVAGAIPVG